MKVLAADLKIGDVMFRFGVACRVESVRQLVTRVAGMTIRAVEITHSSLADPFKTAKILVPETNEIELVNEDA